MVFTVETGTKNWMEIVVVVVANFGFVWYCSAKGHEKKPNMMGGLWRGGGGVDMKLGWWSGPELVWGPKMKEKEDETPPPPDPTTCNRVVTHPHGQW
jgi:murein endopeptidase